MLSIIHGNIFNADTQTVVNTINCVGAMGKGIALIFRMLYPDMYRKYREYCRKGMIDVGKLWLYKSENQWVLNFPTKKDWRYPSKIEYISDGLDKFVATYKEKGITSISFPLLGTFNGGLDENKMLNLMKNRLSSCDIPIYIYIFAKDSDDRIYRAFKERWRELTSTELYESVGSYKSIAKIQDAIDNDEVGNMLSLMYAIGLDTKVFERCFRRIMNIDNR